MGLFSLYNFLLFNDLIELCLTISVVLKYYFVSSTPIDCFHMNYRVKVLLLKNIAYMGNIFWRIF